MLTKNRYDCDYTNNTLRKGRKRMPLTLAEVGEQNVIKRIGGRQDMEAIEYVRNCGCKLIATVHGSSIDDIRAKPLLRKLVQERAFERYVVLGDTKQAGKVTEVFDAQGNPLYSDKMQTA